MKVHGVNDVRQTEIHRPGRLVPEPSAFEDEMAIEKIKRRKSPGIDQILAELVKAGCRTTGSEIHKLNHSIWNKDELPEEWKSRSLYQFTRRVIKQAVLTLKSPN